MIDLDNCYCTAGACIAHNRSRSNCKSLFSFIAIQIESLALLSTSENRISGVMFVMKLDFIFSKHRAKWENVGVVLARVAKDGDV